MSSVAEWLRRKWLSWVGDIPPRWVPIATVLPHISRLSARLGSRQQRLSLSTAVSNGIRIALLLMTTMRPLLEQSDSISSPYRPVVLTLLWHTIPSLPSFVTIDRSIAPRSSKAAASGFISSLTSLATPSLFCFSLLDHPFLTSSNIKPYGLATKNWQCLL